MYEFKAAAGRVWLPQISNTHIIQFLIIWCDVLVSAFVYTTHLSSEHTRIYDF